ncbi:MAG: zinc ribbon domain-containing protein [Clostridia bacterium]|nr:zinc ribbon domain-containing protein [Clostridia bacterium]
MMICRKCGQTLEENDLFCPRCGTPASETALPVLPEEPEKSDREEERIAVDATPETTKPPKGFVAADNTVFILGIISLASSTSACLGALIVANIAMKRYQEMIRTFGTTGRKSRTGFKLARIGRIISKVMLIFLCVYVTLALLFLCVAIIIALKETGAI